MRQTRQPLSNRVRALLPKEIVDNIADHRKSCDGKVRYENGDLADAAARDTSKAQSGEYFIAYQCRHGPHLHVGHATFSDYVVIDGEIVPPRQVWYNGEPVSVVEITSMAVQASEQRLNVKHRAFQPTSAKVGDRVPPANMLGYGKAYGIGGRRYVDGPNGESFVLNGADYERIR